MLLMALWRRSKSATLMHHSDHGSQCTSDEFQQLFKSQNITCNMSRRGECWDIAAMESFFSTLKTVRCARAVYRAMEQTRADVFGYIERFYNPLRKHSKLDYLSPDQFEERQRLKGWANRSGSWGKPIAMSIGTNALASYKIRKRPAIRGEGRLFTLGTIGTFFWTIHLAGYG